MKKFEYGQRVLHNKTDLARIVGQDDETTYKIIHDNDCEWVYANADRLEPVSDWIPCSERMPEPWVDVLLTDGEDVTVTQWSGDVDDIEDNVLTWHWMPLPTPPQDQ